MQTSTRSHQRLSTAALRAAVSTGAAVAAVLLVAPGAGAATGNGAVGATTVTTAQDPAGGIPCTGSPFDAIIGPYLGNDCGGGTGGGPGDDNGGNPPPPGFVS
jgi:hypothetical protein